MRRAPLDDLLLLPVAVASANLRHFRFDFRTQITQVATKATRRCQEQPEARRGGGTAV